MQGIIGLCVGREPVSVVDLLAPGSEFGEEIFLSFLALANVGHALAVSLHNLKILVVHPDPPLKVALLTFNAFGSDIEHVTVQLVFLLLSDVKDVVLGNLLRGQDERQSVPDVVDILRRHRDLGKRTLRREYHVFQAFSLIVEYHIENFMIFTVVVGRFNPYVLPVRVLLPSFFEFLFLGGEAANDFFRSGSLGL